MRERWHAPLALWQVHFNLLGGWRRAGLIAIGYSLALVLGLYLFRRALPNLSTADFAAGFVHFLIVAQGLILVAGGSNAIYRAMLRDFDSRMLESHRLTPMANVAVICGYATGPTLQILFLALLNLLVGTVFSILAQKPLAVWWGGNALMFLGAAVFWSFTIFLGLRSAKPLNPTVLMILVGGFGLPVLAVPAVGSFLGVYPIIAGLLIAREDAAVPFGAVVLMSVFSLLLIAFWVHVSAAKYRRPDLPVLNGFRGLALLALWMLTAAVGVQLVHSAPQAIPGLSALEDSLSVQFPVMLIGGLVLLWIVLSGSVECALIVRRGGMPRGHGDRLADLTVTLGSVALLTVLPMLLTWRPWWELTHADRDNVAHPVNPWVRASLAYGWIPLAATILLAALTARGVFRTLYARIPRRRVRAGAAILLTCLLPLALDMVRIGVRLDADASYEPEFSAISAFSPVGAILIVMLTHHPVPLAPGLAFQAALALWMTWWGRHAVRARLESDTAVPPAPG